MKKAPKKQRTALKQFRIGVHLKQSEMGEKCGVSRGTYAYIENGKRSGSAKFWSNLQSAFNVPDEKMYQLMKLDEKEKGKCEETNAK